MADEFNNLNNLNNQNDITTGTSIFEDSTEDLNLTAPNPTQSSSGTRSAYSDAKYGKIRQSAADDTKITQAKLMSEALTSSSTAENTAADTAVVNAANESNNRSLLGKSDAIDTSSLYKEVLGQTAYSELKQKCGIPEDGSLQAYVNAGGKTPVGYEKEMRLALVEERRMKEYVKYENGEQSETDFLYNAYGKDLMEESGYDLDSPLFWKNRREQGLTGNPLDSDQFLSSLISNARSLWQAEEWYKDSQTLSTSSLSKMATGTKLDEESFAEIFNAQYNNIIESLKPYFDNDVSKIIKYYQAGYIDTNTLNPFFDTDHDGKYDYYYHTDGKLYAIKGSSGVGSSQVEIEYSDADETDSEGNATGYKKVHSIEVVDSVMGAAGAFGESFRDFWVSFLDLVAMPVCGLASIWDDGDALATWEATKKSSNWLGAIDYVNFDGKKDTDDYVIGISRGLGTVAGMVCMLGVSYGLNLGAEALRTGAKLGAEAGTTAAKQVAGATTKEAVGKIFTEQLDDALRLAGNMSKKQSQTFVNNFVKSFYKNTSKDTAKLIGKKILKEELITAASQTAAKSGITGVSSSLAKTTLSNTGGRIVSGLNKTFGTFSRGKGGNLISNTVFSNPKTTLALWGQSALSAAELSVKDAMQNFGQLTAENRARQYMTDIGVEGYEPLSTGEIWVRAGVTFITEWSVSTVLRAQGSNTLSSRFNEFGQGNSLNVVNKAMNSSSKEAQQLINNFMSRRRPLMFIDNTADIIENILTMSLQSTLANQNIEIGSGKGFGQTLWNTVTSPEVIVSNLYIGVTNRYTTPISTSIGDDRMASLIGSVQKFKSQEILTAANKISAKLGELGDKSIDDALRNCETKWKTEDAEYATKNPDESLYSKTVRKAKQLDELFDYETITQNENIKKAITEALGEDFSDALKAVEEQRKAIATKKETETNGVFTQMILNQFNKVEMQRVIDTYNAILSTTKSEYDKRTAKYKEFQERHKLLSHIFKNKTSLDQWGKFYTELTEKAGYSDFLGFDEDGRPVDFTLESIWHSFVSSRFPVLQTKADALSENKLDSEIAGVANKESNARTAGETELAEKFNSNMKVWTPEALVNFNVKATEAVDKDGNKTGKIILEPIKSDKLEAEAPAMTRLINLVNEGNTDAQVQFDKLVELGFIEIETDDTGRSVYKFNSNTGYVYFEKLASDNNQTKADFAREKETNFYNLLDIIAEMYGEQAYLDNSLRWNVPPLVRLEIPNKNGGSPDIIYIVGQQANGTFKQGIDGVSAVSSMLLGAYRLSSISKLAREAREAGSNFKLNESQKVTAVQTLVQLGALNDETAVAFKDIIEKFNDANNTRDQIEQQKKYDKLFEEFGTVNVVEKLLSVSKFEKNPTGLYLINKDGLLTLFDANVFSRDVLETIIQQATGPSGNKSSAADIAQKILNYDDSKSLAEKIRKAITDAREQNKTEFTNEELKSINEYCVKLADYGQLDSLEDAKLITKEERNIIEEADVRSNFFNGLLKNGKGLGYLSEILKGLNENERKKKIRDFIEIYTSPEDFESIKTTIEKPVHEVVESINTLINNIGFKNVRLNNYAELYSFIRGFAKFKAGEEVPQEFKDLNIDYRNVDYNSVKMKLKSRYGDYNLKTHEYETKTRTLQIDRNLKEYFYTGIALKAFEKLSRTEESIEPDVDKLLFTALYFANMTDDQQKIIVDIMRSDYNSDYNNVIKYLYSDLIYKVGRNELGESGIDVDTYVSGKLGADIDQYLIPYEYYTKLSSYKDNKKTLELIKENNEKYNVKGEDSGEEYAEAINYKIDSDKQELTQSTDVGSSRILDILEIIVGHKLALDDFFVTSDIFNTGEHIKIKTQEGEKTLGELIITNPIVTRVSLDSDFKENYIDEQIDYVNSLMKFYYEDGDNGTINHKSNNTVVVNINQLLPRQLYQAVKIKTQDALLLGETGLQARLSNNDLSRDFENLIKGSFSNSQLRAWQNIKQTYGDTTTLSFDLNKTEEVVRLKQLLTSLGYDNEISYDLERLKTNVTTIPGITFKTLDNHCLDTDIKDSDFSNWVKIYYKNKAKKVYNDIKNKDHVEELYSLFSNIEYVNGDTILYGDSKLEDTNKNQIKAQVKYGLDNVGPIYETEDGDDFSNHIMMGYSSVGYSLTTKGNLSGGANEKKLLTNYRSYVLDTDSVKIVSKSKNTADIIKIVRAVIQYLSNPQTEGKTFKVYIKPKDKELFENTYSKLEELNPDNISKDNIKYSNSLYLYQGPQKKNGKLEYTLSVNPVLFKTTESIKTDDNLVFDVLNHLTNPDNDKDFSLQMLLPHWAEGTDKRFADIPEDQMFSDTTIFKVITDLNIEGLRTVDEVKEFFNQNFKSDNSTSKQDGIKKSDTFYAINSNTYKTFKDFIEMCAGESIETIISYGKKEKNNFFIQNYCNQLELSLAYSKKGKAEIDKIGSNLSKFMNRKALHVIGTLLNSEPKYEKLLDENYTPTSEELNKFANDINNEYKKQQDIPYDRTDNFRLYGTLKGQNLNVNESDVKMVLDLMRNSYENFLQEIYYDDNNNDLLDLDLVMSGLTKILDYDTDTNNTLVSLEHLLNLTKAEKNRLLEFLSAELKRGEYGLTGEQKDSIDKLVEKLFIGIDNPDGTKQEAKFDILARTIKAREYAADNMLTKQIPQRNIVPGQPGASQTGSSLERGFIFNKGTLKNNSFKNKITEMVLSGSFYNAQPNAYIKASEIRTNEIEANGFKRAFARVFNATTVQYSDKPGSIMVANMDSDQALSHFILSSVSFTEKLSKVFETSNKEEQPMFKNFDDKNQKQRMLNEIALKLNVLTSGTDYQAETGSFMIVKYNPTTGEYKITPLSISTGNPEKSLYRYLLGQKLYDIETNEESDFSIETINKDKDNQYMLIRGSKNSFYGSIEGCGDDVKVLNLKDKETQKEIFSAMVYKAELEIPKEQWAKVYNKDTKYTPLKLAELRQQAIADYYSVYNWRDITTRDIISNLAKEFRKAGVGYDVIQTVLPTIRNLYVGNETSINEQVVKNSLQKLLTSSKQRLNNYQFESFVDAVRGGVNFASLDTDDKIKFNGILNTLEEKYLLDHNRSYSEYKDSKEKVEIFKELIDAILYPNSEEGLQFTKKRINEILFLDDTIKNDKGLVYNIKMTDEDRVLFVKMLFYTRLSGNDLNAIALGSKDKSVGDIIKERQMSSDNTRESWYENLSSNPKLNEKIYDTFDQHTYAVWDSEWLIGQDGSQIKDPTYQIAFIIKNKDGSESNFQILIADNIKPTDNSRQVYKKDSQNAIIHEDVAVYIEDEESFNKKINAVDKIGIGNSSTENGISTYIVKTKAEATKMFKKLLKDNGVDVLMGYNTRANQDNIEQDSDNNLLLRDDKKFFHDIYEMDILQYNRNHLSEVTQYYSFESMDDFRKRGIIKTNNDTSAHDALSDVRDELQLLQKIKEAQITTTDFYTKPYKDLQELLGLNNKKFMDLMNQVVFDEKNKGTHFAEITENINNLKMGADVVKSLLQAYNLTFEHIARRAEIKRLDRLIDPYMNTYFSETINKYKAKVQNSTTRTKTATVLLKLFKLYYDNDTKLDKLEIKDIKGEEKLRAAIDNFSYILSSAQSLYNQDTDKPHYYGQKYISNLDKSRLFFAEDDTVIEKYIAKAIAIDNKCGRKKSDDYIKNRKEVIEDFNNGKLPQTLNTNMDQSEIDFALNNQHLLKLLSDDSKDYLMLINKDTETIESPLESKAKTDYSYQIFSPIRDMLGMNKKSKEPDDISGLLTDKLKELLVEDISNPYGATPYVADMMKIKANDNKVNGIRRDILEADSSIKKLFEDEFFSETGLFGKRLIQETALWSMGHNSGVTYNDKVQDGVLYIGEKFFASSKGFKELNILPTDKVEAGKEFYCFVWRQPMQQGTPINILKVVITDNESFTMTSRTAKNYFNGDFDGDAYCTSFPNESLQKDMSYLWGTQTAGSGLFSHLTKQVDINGKVSSAFSSRKSNDYVQIHFDEIKKAFNNESFKELFKEALDNPTPDNIQNAKNELSKSLGLSTDNQDFKDIWNDYGVNMFMLKSGNINNAIGISHAWCWYNTNTDIAKSIRYNNEIANAQKGAGFIDQAQGQIAKNLLNIDKTSDPVKKSELNKLISFANDNITEDEVAILANKIKTKQLILDKQSIDGYVKDLVNQGLITATTQQYVNAVLDNVYAITDKVYEMNSKGKPRYSSVDNTNVNIAARYLSLANNMIQQDVNGSKNFNTKLSKILDNQFKSLDNELQNKYQALHETMNKYEMNVGEAKTEMNGMAYLTEVSKLFNEYFDEKDRKQYVSFRNNNNLAMSKIYSDIVMGKLNLADADNVKGRIEVITGDGTVRDYGSEGASKDQTVVGWAKTYIAVSTDSTDETLDSAIYVKPGAEGSDLRFSDIVKVHSKNMSIENKKALYNALQKKIGLDGKTLNKLLNTTMFVEDAIYAYNGYKDKMGNGGTDKIDPNDSRNLDIVFTRYTTLDKFIQNNEVKIALKSSKAGKATVVPYMPINAIKKTKNGKEIPYERTITANDFSFIGNKKIVPSFIMSANLFDPSKQGNEVKLVSTAEFNGKTYNIYETDITLLNTQNLQAQDTAKNKAFDIIGITQGAYGLGSILNFGNLMFYENENREWVFDPGSFNTKTNYDDKGNPINVTTEATGLRGLLESVKRKNTGKALQDTNAIRVVMFTRIAAELKAMSNSSIDDLIKDFNNITNNATPIKTKEELLEYLYKCDDLGGEFGFSMFNYIYDNYFKLDEANRKALEKLVNKKSNKIIRAAFSEEVERSINPQNPTFFEYNEGDYMLRKNEKPTRNVRGYSTKEESSLDDLDILAEGSKRDVNRGYVSAVGFLELILSQRENGFLNSTALREAYKNGIVEAKEIINGNLTNGYKPINKAEAEDVRPYQRQVAERKTGGQIALAPSTKVYSNSDMLALMPKSKYASDKNRNQERTIKGIGNNLSSDNKNRYNNLALALGFFTNGDEYQLYDANNLYMNRFQLETERKVAVMSDNKDDIVLDVDVVTPNIKVDNAGNNIISKSSGDYSRRQMTAEETLAFIKENTKSAKKADLLRKKQKEINLHVFSADEIKSMSPKKQLSLMVYISKQSRSNTVSPDDDYFNVLQNHLAKAIDDYQNKIKSEQEQSKANGIEESENNSTVDTKPDFYSPSVKLGIDVYNNPKTYDELVKEGMTLTASDNGIKLKNSLLSSYGFKSDQNLEIGLGKKTLNFQTNIAKSKQEIGGTEYAIILATAKVNPGKIQELNAYMRAEALIESYTELTGKNKDVWVKKFGEDKYNQMVEAVNKELLQAKEKPEDKAEDIVNQMIELQKSLLNDNPTLQTLVDAAINLNKRITETARQKDPMCFLGWFADMTDFTKNKRGLFGHKYVRIATTFKDDFLKGIEYEFDKMSNNKKLSLFYNEDLGYIGMIDKIISQISTEDVSKDIGNYCKKNGYMRNLHVYNIAIGEVSKHLDQFFNTARAIDMEKSDEVRKVNKLQYETFMYLAQEAGIDVSSLDEAYSNPKQLHETYKLITAEYQKVMAQIMADNPISAYDNESALEYIHQQIKNTNSSTVAKTFSKEEKIVLLYEDTMAQMTQLLMQSNDRFFSNIYEKISKEAKDRGQVLVDEKGRKIDNSTLVRDYSSWKFTEDLITSFRMQELASDNGTLNDRGKWYYATQACLGNIYFMDKTVADQLETKVYSVRKNSKTNALLKKIKNLSTTLIMTTPVQMVDRWINFPMFDTGIVLSADVRNAQYMPTASATVMKFIASGDSLTDDSLRTDPNIKYLLRFLANAKLNENETSVRGEKLSLTNVPGIKQYIQLANKLYNAGNLIPRFAYYLNIVKNAEENGYVIDKTRTGVALHRYNGIVGNEQTAGIESHLKNVEDSIMYKNWDSENNVFVKDSDAQRKANLDAQACEIIAQHNGIEGDMPYAARWLNNNYNTMFLTFPLALIRWGKNRLSSIGYSLTHDCTKSESFKYLINQTGSMLASYCILLAIQVMLSGDTREYLEEKLFGKDDEELTDDQITNAQNILFRGGCVKLFDTITNGYETTSTGQNRGPISSLFNSYIADFIPEYNDDYSEDGFMKTVWNKLMEKTLGHTNFAVKDIIESVPGNTVLQSTSWYTPGDDFASNYARKVLAYTMGYSQANAFMDYMETHNEYEDESSKSFAKNLRQAMAYAYTKKYSNLKENKSEYKNYKKAFQIIREYWAVKYNDSDYDSSTSSAVTSLQTYMKKVVETSNSSADIYLAIQQLLTEGTTYTEIQKALKYCSLREKLMTMSDYNDFIDTLTDSEYDVIKTALIYEDNNYPGLSDILEEVNRQQRKEYLATLDPYTVSIESKLNTYEYNSRKSTSNSYYNTSNYINSVNNKWYNNYNNRKNNKNYNNYNKQSNPMEAYNNAMNTWQYGTSTDIYGNKSRHYTDGSSYTIKDYGSTNLSSLGLED
jgi:hypothetical protein